MDSRSFLFSSLKLRAAVIDETEVCLRIEMICSWLGQAKTDRPIIDQVRMPNHSGERILLREMGCRQEMLATCWGWVSAVYQSERLLSGFKNCRVVVYFGELVFLQI